MAKIPLPYTLIKSIHTKTTLEGSEVLLTIKSSGAGLSFGCFFMLCNIKQNVRI